MRIGTVLAIVAWLLVAPQQAGAGILINEVLADPPAGVGDANHDGVVSSTQDEFVELVNTGHVPVTLTGWSLADSVRVRHIFGIDSIVPARGFFVVFGGGSSSRFPHAAVATSGGLGLNNDSDIVLLRDVSGMLSDSLSYGAEGGRDSSLTRNPDSTGLFVLHSSVNRHPFSPGTTVGGVDTLPQEPRSEPRGEHGTVPEPPPASLVMAGFMMIKMWRRRET